MKLNDQDCQVLRVAQFNADLSTREIAKLAGCREHIARRVISKLKDREIIKKFYYIDVYSLGYSFYDLYFSLNSRLTKHKKKLVDALVASPLTSFVTEHTGSFDFCVTLCVKQASEVLAFIEALSNSFPSIFRERSISSLVSLREMPIIKTPLGSKYKISVHTGMPASIKKADELDSAILSMISDEAELTNTKIARSLNTALSTIDNRVERLKANKIIAGSRYFIDVSKCGYSFHVHHVYTAGLNAVDRKLLSKEIENHPAVYFVADSIGPWDFSVGTRVTSAKDLLNFTDSITEKFDSVVLKINTLSISKIHKIKNFPISRPR